MDNNKKDKFDLIANMGFWFFGLVVLIFMLYLDSKKAHGSQDAKGNYELFIIVQHDSAEYTSYLHSDWVNYNDCQVEGKKQVKKTKLKKGEYAGYYCLAFKKEG